MIPSKSMKIATPIAIVPVVSIQDPIKMGGRPDHNKQVKDLMRGTEQIKLERMPDLGEMGL